MKAPSSTRDWRACARREVAPQRHSRLQTLLSEPERWLVDLQSPYWLAAATVTQTSPRGAHSGRRPASVPTSVT